MDLEPRHTAQPHPFKHSWPLRRNDYLVLVAAYVGLTLLWWGVGELVTQQLRNSWLVDTDRRLAEWFAEHRSQQWNQLSNIGSWLAETLTKVAVTAVVGIVLLIVFKRWLEALVIALPLVLEAMIFISVTWLVARPRPDVPRLDASPVDSSFPSGHTAAAVVYAAMVVVVFWHTRKVWVRALAVVVAVSVPIAVAVARMYRGMHFLTDVIAGALLGGVVVVITTRLLEHAARRNEAEAKHMQPQLDGGQPATTPLLPAPGMVSR